LNVSNHARVEIPHLRALGRHAVPHLLEATIIPLGLFYATLSWLGIWGAILVGLGWSYAAILRRLIQRKGVPGLLLLGTFGLTARTVVALASHSVFVYFLQPTFTTVGIAAAFLVSLALEQPLAQRLAGDFCPFPDGFFSQPGVKRFFAQITVLWGFVQLANAAITITLLITQPVATYVAARAVISVVVTVGAVAASAWWFRKSMRHHGIEVVWSHA
jgi:hypothetical protein